MWGLVERAVEWSVEDVERQLGCSREAVLGILPLELYRVRGVVGIGDLTGEIRDDDWQLHSGLLVDVYLICK